MSDPQGPSTLQFDASLQIDIFYFEKLDSIIRHVYISTDNLLNVSR